MHCLRRHYSCSSNYYQAAGAHQRAEPRPPCMHCGMHYIRPNARRWRGRGTTGTMLSANAVTSSVASTTHCRQHHALPPARSQRAAILHPATQLPAMPTCSRSQSTPNHRPLGPCPNMPILILIIGCRFAATAAITALPPLRLHQQPSKQLLLQHAQPLKVTITGARAEAQRSGTAGILRPAPSTPAARQRWRPASAGSPQGAHPPPPA